MLVYIYIYIHSLSLYPFLVSFPLSLSNAFFSAVLTGRTDCWPPVCVCVCVCVCTHWQSTRDKGLAAPGCELIMSWPLELSRLSWDDFYVEHETRTTGLCYAVRASLCGAAKVKSRGSFLSVFSISTLPAREYIYIYIYIYIYRPCERVDVRQNIFQPAKERISR